MTFHQFTFHVPSWWGQVLEDEFEWQWKRTDTRYDWLASIKLEKDLNRNISIEEDFKNRIEELELVFDLDSADVLFPSDFKNQAPVKEGHLELVRIEGTATQHGIDRCYFDAFLVRDLKHNETLFASSHSSVLNGLVEGPYFEEMMLNLQWHPKKERPSNEKA